MIKGLPSTYTILDIYKANEITKLAHKAEAMTMPEFRKLILNQIQILESEIQETKVAIENEDNIELLDGICDIFVVATGILQFGSKKFDTTNAVSHVAYNNLTKFPTMSTTFSIDEVVCNTIDKYKEQRIEVDVLINNEYNCVVFLNKATGKYLKPVGYKSVDLQKYV